MLTEYSCRLVLICFWSFGLLSKNTKLKQKCFAVLVVFTISFVSFIAVVVITETEARDKLEILNQLPVNCFIHTDKLI